MTPESLDRDTASASSGPAAPPSTAAAGNTFNALLGHMVTAGASDMFLTVGAVPTFKVGGRMAPLRLPPLASGVVRQFAEAIMSPEDLLGFQKRLAHDMALHLDGQGRFRVNVYMQRGEVSMVVRHVRDKLPSREQLQLPPVLEQLALLRQGLVLVVGAAGSGKSTTVASMLDHRIRTTPGHVVTIEDPIEFLHAHHRSIVDQREVGLDTPSFGDALRDAMREAPDVIMIGEVRDEDTLRHALHYADSGHLCITTLHANNANQTIDRILNYFPEGARRRVLMDLSQNLKGVVALRLIEGAQGGRVPASEVMLQSSYISDLIAKGEIDQIKQAISRSESLGMQTFDQSLHDLYRRKLITQAQALEHADSRTDLSLRIRLSGGNPSAEPGLA